MRPEMRYSDTRWSGWGEQLLFFTAKAVVVKRERMNYSDPVFDPKTAELTIRLSVYPDVASSSLQKLNASLTSYVVMAKLSS